MRVLFATLPEKSHLFCMTPIAWAMRAAGHEVRVASSPAFTDVIARTGMTAVGVGDDSNISSAMAQHRESQEVESVDWSELDPARLTYAQELERAQMGAWGFAYYNEPMIPDLVAFARQWRPDLVVWDPLTYAGAIAARASGAAHVRSMCFADVWVMKRQLFAKLRDEQPEAQRQDPMAEWLGGHAEKLGGAFGEDLVTGQLTLDPLPERLSVPSDVRRVPVRFVPYNGPAIVPGWLAEPPARPRVCLSLGAANTERYGGDYVSKGAILDALADLDVEVVAALLPAQAAELGTVPDNARVVSSVPLHALLPTCAALIHHGGFGSYATALVHGVPQLFVATAVADQILRGTGLQDAGAGLLIPHHAVSAEGIRDAVHRLVSEPGFAAGADVLRREATGRPAPAAIVGELERLAAESRLPGWSQP
ncbi:activator-dependent family glycosyltransferase [Dactylosporangium matsuzakiense]|uniref:Glycosyl transferase n=1 Tax=Dactylosporangium matsuzakiense TaxID=53360 RepID=A0A9W6KTA9_9ACTN|nr:activator-dependent family glycosyltransferase [Dactylosporangium matsuzakiense]UWZ41217.1 activator-dependent family glycosyltransferase [Dactylosporangium matsuzakiense]GLL07697.1 glycosyl transferase [Dactylosporangium matsuzakiense]